MVRTLRMTLIAALAVLCVISPLALADDGTLSGTIQNVDPQQGRITVRVGEEDVLELRAPADLLIGFRSGDVVEVKRAGQKAVFIQRREGNGQRPVPGGALRLPYPAELPKSP
jgi:hypothetical protein